MAATFVVEDGTGKTDANSYVSEADADSYWENHSDPSTWSGESQANKENALRMATQYLDAVYHSRWKSVRTNETQALDWPRAYVYDRDGFLIDDDALPQRLLDACCELALLHLTEDDGLLPDLSSGSGTIKRKKVKADVIEKDVEYVGGAVPWKRFRLVDKLLDGLITPPGTAERG